MAIEIQPQKRDLLKIGGVASIAVNETATVYSNSIEIPQNASFGYEITASGTTIDLKVEFEQGNVVPTTEVSADTVNFATPQGASALIANLTTGVLHVGALSPIVSRYGRFKITGQGSSSADVLVTKLRIIYAYDK